MRKYDTKRISRLEKIMIVASQTMGVVAGFVAPFSTLVYFGPTLGRFADKGFPESLVAAAIASGLTLSLLGPAEGAGLYIGDYAGRSICNAYKASAEYINKKR